MKKILLILLLSSFFLPSYSQWRELGETPSNMELAYPILYTIDTFGNIYYSSQDSLTQHIYKWDGKKLINLGILSNPTDTVIFTAMCVDLSGNLYVAGYFYGYNKVGTFIKKWDGINWTNLQLPAPSGFNYMKVIDNGDLYVSAYDNSHDSTTYKWNGNNWKLLDNDSVKSSLVTYNIEVNNKGKILAVGNLLHMETSLYEWTQNKWKKINIPNMGFSDMIVPNYDSTKMDNIMRICSDKFGNFYFLLSRGITDTIYDYVLKWDGNNFSYLGIVDKSLYYNSLKKTHGITVDNKGGIFVSATNEKTYIKKWENGVWTTCETNTNSYMAFPSPVSKLISDNKGNIYLMSSPNINTRKFCLYKWDGSVWQAAHGNQINANKNIATLCSDKSGNIYAGGYFIENNSSNSFLYVSQWNGYTWEGVTIDYPTKYVHTKISSIKCNSKNDIVVAGDILSGGFFQNTFIKKGPFLTEYRNGIKNTIYNEIKEILFDSNDSLYAIINRRVYKNIGSNWFPLESPTSKLYLNDVINTIISDKQNNIYVAGNFTNSIRKCYVAKWDGQSWSELGTGGIDTGNIYQLTIDSKGNIYAVGGLISSNKKFYIAKWDGQTWSKLGNMFFDKPFTSICTDYKDNLYLYDGFSKNLNIYKWNGSTLSLVDTSKIYNLDTNKAAIITMMTDKYGNLYAAGVFKNKDSFSYVAVLNSCNSSSQISRTICKSNLPLIWYGKTFTIDKLSDTIIVKNYKGCDSFVNLVLKIKDYEVGYKTLSVCNQSLPIQWYGKTFSYNKKFDTVIISNPNGCDSLLYLSVVSSDYISKTYYNNVCKNNLPLQWYGKTFTSTHLNDTTIIVTSNGCDSLLELIVDTSRFINYSVTKKLCNNNLPFQWYGKTFTSSHLNDTSYVKNPNGCDSLINMSVILNNNIIQTYTKNVCKSNLPIQWYGKTFSISKLTDTLFIKNSLGCDSLITLQVILDSINKNITYSNNILQSSQTGATYQWVNCKNPMSIINGATSKTYIPNASGDYAVIISKNGCKDTSACLKVSITNPPASIVNPSKQILVYPNPSKDIIYINFIKDFSEIQLKLINLNGRVLKNYSIKGTKLYQLEIKDLVQGEYILEFEIDNGNKETIKIIKE